jgi:hypothetical protein
MRLSIIEPFLTRARHSVVLDDESSEILVLLVRGAIRPWRVIIVNRRRKLESSETAVILKSCHFFSFEAQFIK